MTGVTGPTVTLVLGGARSGKSNFAESLALESGLAKIYVATAEAFDDEMRSRIAAHKDVREGQGWKTIEEPLNLAAVIEKEAASDRVLLVDCLTLWLSNLMGASRQIETEFRVLIETLAIVSGPVILVSNEVGMGIVPENAVAREFGDHAGRLHQRIAGIASNVYLIAAGLPLKLKG